MALHLKFKPRRLRPFRCFSSSSNPTPPLPPPESAADEVDSPSDPPPPSYSYFSDIKERLRSTPTPPRRIPDNPPPPPFLSGANPSPTTSLEDIRKMLADFHNKSGGPSPPSSPTPPTLSFQELHKNSVLKGGSGGGGGDGNAPAEKRDHLSFGFIRESLRKDKRDGQQQLFPGSFNLKYPQKNLGPNNVDPLPVSIFGKELRKKEEGGDGEAKALKTEFLRTYTYEQLGEKLRKLRPDAAAKGGNQWFSLAELNERLAKLRELEEKEIESSMAGVSFRVLRESLVHLKEADANKKSSSGFFLPLAWIGFLSV